MVGLIGVIIIGVHHVNTSRIDTAYLEFNTPDPNPDEDDPRDRENSNSIGDVASSDADSEWYEEENNDNYN